MNPEFPEAVLRGQVTRKYMAGHAQSDYIRGWLQTIEKAYLLVPQ